MQGGHSIRSHWNGEQKCSTKCCQGKEWNTVGVSLPVILINGTLNTIIALKKTIRLMVFVIFQFTRCQLIWNTLKYFRYFRATMCNCYVHLYCTYSEIHVCTQKAPINAFAHDDGLSITQIIPLISDFHLFHSFVVFQYCQDVCACVCVCLLACRCVYVFFVYMQALCM